MDEFEPRIIGFCCNWAAYAGIDQAGISQIQYAPNLAVIRVTCSGAVDPVWILEAFRSSVDGVLLIGCHPGACHYQNGNLCARSRVAVLKPLLEAIGVGSDRLRLQWILPPEERRFADVATEFTHSIKNLGPSPFRRMQK